KTSEPEECETPEAEPGSRLEEAEAGEQETHCTEGRHRENGRQHDGASPERLVQLAHSRCSLPLFGAAIPARRLAACAFEPRRDISPVDDVPERRDVVGSPILVLQVVRVFPRAHDEEGYASLAA